jgi:phosphatidate cytidylyltransferase
VPASDTPLGDVRREPGDGVVPAVAPRREPLMRWPRLSPMLVRILSAAVLIAAILVALAFGFWAAAIILGALILAGTAELYLITRRLGAPAAPWVLFPLTLLLLFRFQLDAANPVLLPLGITLAVFAGLAGFVFSRTAVDGMTRWAYAVGGALYLGWSLGFYFAFYAWRGPSVALAWLIALAGSAVFGDTTALLVGTHLGRHRFFPRISPRKTVEGAVGGFLAQTAFFTVFSLLVDIPMPHGLILGALVAVAAQAGDLVESQLKRAAGLKDASNLVPGHGGMLDRIDSLVMLGGVAYYYLALVLHVKLPQ